MYIQCVSLYVGGYGYVFVAQDTQSGKEYALKVLYGCMHTQYSTSVHFALSEPSHYEVAF